MCRPYPILDAFTNSFQAEVTKQCPACKTSIANVTIPQLTAGQVPSVLVSALRSNSSAKYLVFDDGPFADGVTSALAAAGLGGVKVIGEAADNAGVAALKTGKEQAWTGYDPSYQAYLAMDAMFRDAEGYADPARAGGHAADPAAYQGDGGEHHGVVGAAQSAPAVPGSVEDPITPSQS